VVQVKKTFYLIVLQGKIKKSVSQVALS
jgi:hypothetical protein